MSKNPSGGAKSQPNFQSVGDVAVQWLLLLGGRGGRDGRGAHRLWPFVGCASAALLGKRGAVPRTMWGSRALEVLQCRVHKPKYPSKSPLFLGSLDRLQALFTFYAYWGCWDPRTASPSAWQLSNCYPQYSAGGRWRPLRPSRPLEKAIKIILLAYCSS